MNKPLVSIGMPLYNGEQFLEEAILSLLSQDYGNFELIILDNLSTDQSGEICRKYAKKDGRVRYILDDRMRTNHDGATHVASFTRGEYYMPASDDDRWEKNYVSKLVSILDSDRNIGLAYCSGYFIDSGGNRIRPFHSSAWQFLESSNSKLYDFCHYLILRNAVPVALGIYRTEIFKKALPFKVFDATVADVDNLFVLKLFSMTKVQGIDEPLLYYRTYQRVNPDKEFWADPKYGKYPKNKSAMYMWFYYLNHERRFIAEIFRVINESSFSISSMLFLKGFAILATFIRKIILPIYIYGKNIIRKR